jgi:prepilin-type N-terminal cleavage/methylation domain-containing protein
MKRNQSLRGFTLVEIAVGIALLGLVLLAFAGMTSLVQKGAGRTRDYTDAQQNARAALDYLTSQLREAGSDVAAYDGQGTVVSAGPYQLAFNADIDAGQTIQGQAPMTAIDKSQGNNTVPVAGTAIYRRRRRMRRRRDHRVHPRFRRRNAEVTSADHGTRTRRGTLASTTCSSSTRYGASGGSNAVRTSDDRHGARPVSTTTAAIPRRFSRYTDNDNDLSTPDKLWGDTDGDGELARARSTTSPGFGCQPRGFACQGQRRGGEQQPATPRTTAATPT